MALQRSSVGSRWTGRTGLEVAAVGHKHEIDACAIKPFGPFESSAS
jgi:hypothetical protein